MRLTGDEGARRLLANLNTTHLVEIPQLDDAAMVDIDTPRDLAGAWSPGGPPVDN
jgi:CTP:molybdopterin cytidylyltransferase MocA